MMPMTDLASAMADTSKLGQHDGRDVVRTTVKITKAGDGLSEALKIDPQELHHGQRVAIVLEGVVGPITYDPIMDKGEDTGILIRVHTIRTETATIVDRILVGEALDTQRQRIKEARDAAAGQTTIDQALADSELIDRVSTVREVDSEDEEPAATVEDFAERKRRRSNPGG